jgi:hypothetical protein
MIGYPRNAKAGTPKAESEDEVYAIFRKLIDSTSMAVVLYGSPVESLRQFHPTGLPLSVFDRLADHPSVVGIKLTHPMSAATAFEICERLSDRLIMGPCNFDHIPLLAKNYKNVQWSGLWITDALQSPEKPYAVEVMDLVNKRRFTEAMKVYWQMQPLIQGIYDLQAPLLLHEVDCSFLISSSSSRTSIGIARLLSWNLKTDCGSCSSTLVSSTKVLTFPDTLIRDLGAGAPRRLSIDVDML